MNISQFVIKSYLIVLAKTLSNRWWKGGRGVDAVSGRVCLLISLGPVPVTMVKLASRFEFGG